MTLDEFRQSITATEPPAGISLALDGFGNAAYWYSRTGKPVCREPLGAEWLSIVTELLRRGA
jgi:hypothetical protein